MTNLFNLFDLNFPKHNYKLKYCEKNLNIKKRIKYIETCELYTHQKALKMTDLHSNFSFSSLLPLSPYKTFLIFDFKFLYFFKNKKSIANINDLESSANLKIKL